MKKKHKKILMKLLATLITMLVVTGVGYYKSTFEPEVNEQILAKPRNGRNIRGIRSII